jgi:hypothetical protein
MVRLLNGFNYSMPKAVEIRLHKLIIYVSNRSGEGRALSLDDWKRMRTDAAKFHDALCQIDLAWTEDDKKDSTPSKTTAIKATSTADESKGGAITQDTNPAGM